MRVDAAVALIGPNAVTRVAEVLVQSRGSAVARRLFERAGLVHHLVSPPRQMVAVVDVRALHDAVRAELARIFH
jgi:hypothetical protein